MKLNKTTMTKDIYKATKSKVVKRKAIKKRLDSANLVYMECPELTVVSPGSGLWFGRMH